MPSLWTLAFQLVIVNTFLYSLLGLTVGTSFHCAVRREISPCTCRHQEENTGVIQVTCERMTSFSQVVGALRDKFEPEVKIALTISYSNLEDLPESGFQELGMNVNKLILNFDQLSVLTTSEFVGLDKIQYLSLADNAIDTVPQHILRQMPIIKTLELARCQIQNLSSTDFQNLRTLRTLLLNNNDLSFMDNNSLPDSLSKLHIGYNSLTTLNGTIRSLTGLEWLLIKNNKLTSLDGELPEVVPNTKLMFFDFSNNYLERLPMELNQFQGIDTLYANNNQITSLNGALSRLRKVKYLSLNSNNLSDLAEDDFAEADRLEELEIGFNKLKSLNLSLLPLKELQILNLTNNLLEEFSLQEILGLHKLNTVDLSHNKITKLIGKMENTVDLEIRVSELLLDHNELESLSGALSGLTKLQKLNISHNRLTQISKDDFIDADDLRILDISYNKLTTLEELSKTDLPNLEELKATHNALTVLEKDFHGLPVLCWADLSNNQIKIISQELIEKTQCQLHGVKRALNIYLDDNPLWCDNDMLNTIQKMESHNSTKIHGKTECTIEVNNTLIVPITSIA
uniref:LRRCT domain-containing protein n=1 Tax=Clastoptera arizonana TaxID=38151 RepID=A0A1B6E451_9HEMI